MRIKFGLTFGLNVARLGLDETQVITAAQVADRTNFDSIWAMDQPHCRNLIPFIVWHQHSLKVSYLRDVMIGYQLSSPCM